NARLKVAKFHTRLIPQHWYLDTLDESVTTLENEPVISIVSNEEFNKPGNAIHIDFSHLEDIHGSHIFTKHISHEMKVLNLAIVTNRAEELYEIHKKLVKEMENEIKSQNSQAITENNELQEFAHTINNPVSVKTKGRSSKRNKAFNDVTNILNSKNTKSKMPRIILDSRNDMSDTESISDTEETIVNKRKCGICNMKGHNSRTFPDLAESNIAELMPADNNEEISTNKRKCRICSLEGHNAQTYPSSMKSNISEIEESGSDAEEININKRKCGICGLGGHNARTCQS
ncbi:13585_t:CDS:2, partial [Gigaspora rosea]